VDSVAARHTLEDPVRAFRGTPSRRDVCVTPAIVEAIEFGQLLDHPSVFGKILSLMGPYIYLTGSDMLVRHPRDSTVPVTAFHVDGGPSMQRITQTLEDPVIQLKVQFFLTDLLGADEGNFTLVPGSHRRRPPPRGIHEDELGESPMQVIARAGDALIFPWTLWHAVRPNNSSRARKSIIFRYSQLWCRPVDFESIPEAFLQSLTARRRRLLGNFGATTAPRLFYYPSKTGQVQLMLGSEWNDDVLLHEYDELDKLRL
jgi:hypothetical protein